MRKIVFLVLFSCGGFAPAFSQTNAEKLEEAVKIYNAARAFEDGLKPGKVEESDVDKIKSDAAAANILLEAVKANGTAEEAKVARYFMANFQYEIGFVYGMMGKNKPAYEVLNGIKSEFEYFSNSAVFPLSYKFDSKNYSIKFDNFGPTLAEYYTGMSEICANLSKYDESIGWSQKTIAFSYSSDWYKYIALNKMLDMKEKNSEWDNEMLDYGLQQITLFAQLDTTYLRTISENNYPTSEHGAKKIKSTLEKKPTLAQGEYHRGTAAPLLVKTRKYGLALEFYRAALEKDFGSNNKTYLFDAAAFALEEESNSTAILALDLLYNKNPYLSCAEWDKISVMYGKAGNTEKKNSAATKADECRKKEKKEDKRASSGSKGFGFYAAIYPLPMATRFNRYRDYGGVVGIVLGKFAVEGSYKLINRNFVITDDLTYKSIKQENSYYWDGYRAHLAIKFYPNSSGSDGVFYVGPLVEMVNRTYETIWSDVTNTSTGNTFALNKKFYPQEKSYNLYLNFGSQIVEKKFYVDTFFGFGVAYTKFDAGDEYGDSAYAFSDVLLQNRKATRFSPMIRMGMTIGLGFIKE